MNFTCPRLVMDDKFLWKMQILSTDYRRLQFHSHGKKFCAVTISLCSESGEKRLVVVGGGADGVYGAIRAKTIAPNLHVVVIEKGKPLSKVKLSGGGRCNVTNGYCMVKFSTLLGAFCL
ncbi:uncharacterized protein [Primulina huaijiensis]|uniref:uncharacterized protein isoform X1 n=1 Tax=Primulina huaijiensis TaxID=1492673 RepID=UPI003CC716E3